MTGVTRLLHRAGRDTGSGGFIPEIDGLRCVAIVSVLLFHLNWFVTSKTGRGEGEIPLARFLSHGHIGVQLFFVISGFVIALPFAKSRLLGERPVLLKKYLLRRLTRLEPPYIVNLLLRYALLTLVMGESARELLPHLAASMGYLHNLVYGCMSSVNFVAWSLEVELQFYLLAPLFAQLFRVRGKLPRRALILALILLFTLAPCALDGYQRFSLSLLSAGQFFLTGFLLVDVYLSDWHQAPQRSYRWDLVSFCSWSALLALLYLGERWRLLIPVPIFFAYQGAFRGTVANRLFRQRTVYTIGGMCYTIYLYHYSVLSALLRPLLGLPFWGEFPLWLELVAAALVLLPAVLLVSTLLFLLIEKPCMRRDRRLRLPGWIRPGSKAAA